MASISSQSAIIFRRTYADLSLPGALMDRANQWLSPTDAHWNGQEKCWTFPTGATLSFGYMDTDRDRYRYQSTAFQFVGFDELTQFPETWFTYMRSRLRRLKGSTVPLRLRGATNPGGLGHKWVKKRFVDPGTAVGPFIPSKLVDNPFIDQESYLLSLAGLDPTTLKQLRDGVWIQDTAGLVYSHWDAARHVVPQPKTDREGRHVLAMDFGFDDDCAFSVLGWQKHSRVVYLLESFKRSGLIPSAAAAEAAKLIKRYDPDRVIGDVGGLGKGYAEEMRQRWAIPVEPAKKVDKAGYIRLFNGALASDEFLVVAGSNVDYEAEVDELPWHDEERTKEADGFANHVCDSVLYGWREAKAWTEDEAPVPDGNLPDQFEQARIDSMQQAKSKEWWDA